MIDFVRATGCPKCPQCGGRMVKFKDDVGRWFCRCVNCHCQFPLESGFREVKGDKDNK